MAKENAVKFGISKAYYAVWDAATSEYKTPVALPGAVSLSMSREGDESSFYADNIVYYSMDTNAGYSGDFELAKAPQSVYIDLLGQEVDDNHVLIESTDDKQVPFALLFEVDGNTERQRFCFYNCTLSRPESEANTKEDTVDPDTDTLSIRMTSREFPWGNDTKNAVKASVTDGEETKATFDEWYTKVQLPKKAAA